MESYALATGNRMGRASPLTSRQVSGVTSSWSRTSGALFLIPEPPVEPPAGPGTELLEQVIDLVAAGDLRDYMTTARILHTDMSTYGSRRGRHIYDGGAVPERLVPGTNSSMFGYSANDTRWVNMSTFVYVQQFKLGQETLLRNQDLRALAGLRGAGWRLDAPPAAPQLR